MTTKMNQKTELFCYQLAMTFMVLPFFIWNLWGGDGAIVSFMAVFAVALVTAGFINELPEPTPLTIATIESAGVPAIGATLVVFVAEFTAEFATAFTAFLITFIAIVAALTGITFVALKYAKKNNLTKKYLLASMVTEFVAIAGPMLWTTPK